MKSLINELFHLSMLEIFELLLADAGLTTFHFLSGNLMHHQNHNYNPEHLRSAVLFLKKYFASPGG
jgi:hypothetical protein